MNGVAEDHATWLSMYQELSPEERASYWQAEQRAEQLATISGLTEHIDICKWFIQHAENYATDAKNEYIAGKMDEDEVRKRLVLAAEVIKSNKDTMLYLRGELAHYTKYPIGSTKRKQYLKHRR